MLPRPLAFSSVDGAGAMFFPFANSLKRGLRCLFSKCSQKACSKHAREKIRIRVMRHLLAMSHENALCPPLPRLKMAHVFLGLECGSVRLIFARTVQTVHRDVPGIIEIESVLSCVKGTFRTGPVLKLHQKETEGYLVLTPYPTGTSNAVHANKPSLQLNSARNTIDFRFYQDGYQGLSHCNLSQPRNRTF